MIKNIFVGIISKNDIINQIIIKNIEIYYSSINQNHSVQYNFIQNGLYSRHFLKMVDKTTY